MLSAQAIWIGFVYPAIMAAILAVVGYIVGWIAEIITKKILKGLYYEEWFKAHGIDHALLGINTTDLIAKIVKWWVFLGFFAQAVAFFQLPVVVQMAATLYAAYVSIALGIIYLAIGAIIAQYVGIKMRESNFYGGELGVKAVQAIIMYFAIVTAFPYFGIKDTYIITKAVEIFLWAAAATVAIGLGIAIGLGAQDVVRDIVSKHKKDIEGFFFEKKGAR